MPSGTLFAIDLSDSSNSTVACGICYPIAKPRELTSQNDLALQLNFFEVQMGFARRGQL